MSEALTINMAGIVRESIVDGPGIRFVVFSQGCPHHCPGCHNPETHEMGIGKDIPIERILSAFDENPMLDGITLSGGEPFVQLRAMAALARAVRERGKNVFCYTGYTFEQLLEMGKEDPDVMDLLNATDDLVDGPFILAERNLALRFRGSTNQRILDVAKSLAAGEAVWNEELRD